MKEDRLYRSAELNIVKREEGEQGYFVEGYSSTFKPYVLFRDEDGIEYKEQIDPRAFDNTDMSDVVFRIDHTGPVYARTSNGLIELSVDEKGLYNRINLGVTERAREVFKDIEVGNYPQASFAFTIAPGGFEYDRNTHTRLIKNISKLYDVSAVSFPANPDTSIDISTRDYFHGVMEAEKAERLEKQRREKAKKALALRMKIGGYINGNQ